MIKLKGMHDSMIRCVISEDIPHAEIASAFRDVMSQGQELLPGSRVVLDFGARPLARVIQSRLQNPIAEKILEGVYHDGSVIHVEEVRGDIVLN